jgi:serine/threonine protein kinase
MKHFLRLILVTVLATNASRTISSDGIESECMKNFVEFDDDEETDCPPKQTPLKLVNGAVIEFSSQDTNSHGKFGEIFISNDNKYVLKRLLMSSRQIICREKTTLEYPHGLHGNGAKVVDFAADSGVKPGCVSYSILMEKVGNQTLFGKSFPGNEPLLYLIAARILEIVLLLHDAGFVHGDLHMGNFVFSDPKNIVGTIRLIDFGKARTWLNMNEKAAALAIATDVSKLLFDLGFLQAHAFEIPYAERAFTKYLKRLDNAEEMNPDFGSWVEELRQTAKEKEANDHGSQRIMDF